MKRYLRSLLLPSTILVNSTHLLEDIGVLTFSMFTPIPPWAKYLIWLPFSYLVLSYIVESYSAILDRWPPDFARGLAAGVRAARSTGLVVGGRMGSGLR